MVKSMKSGWMAGWGGVGPNTPEANLNETHEHLLEGFTPTPPHPFLEKIR